MIPECVIAQNAFGGRLREMARRGQAKNEKLEKPLEAVRRLVAAAVEQPGVITNEDIQAEIERLRSEHALIQELIRRIEKLAILRYEDVGAVSKRGPKVK